jgi:peroxiredoxin
MTPPKLAPDWDIAQWFNTDTPLQLRALRGRVVVAAAFQMLCPGCVAQTIPQLRQVHALFPESDVAVIGLHTVFEHHAAMGPAALEAFLHEYQIRFPVGVDRPSDRGASIPVTMQRYGMQGTPTLLLIDREGRLRRQTFGHIPDLQLGAEIMALMREAPDVDAQAIRSADQSRRDLQGKCDADGCAIPNESE